MVWGETMTNTEAEPIEVEQGEDGRILVTLRGRLGTIEGWFEAREDLGLNKAGDALDGVEVVDEEPEYHDPDDEYPYGYNEITLAFDSRKALERARNHLYDKATERFEWGADGDKVQSFVGRLPTDTEVSHHV